jgi:ZIP family zinc transporter
MRDGRQGARVIGEALLLGGAAQLSLLLAGLAATVFHVPARVVGALAGFGAGALVSAIAVDLTDQAEAIGAVELTVWLLIGAVVFIGGDAVVERRFGTGGAGGALGIVVGSVVDGVPESLIFGIGVATGSPVSLGFIGAVFVSNVPQALAPSVDLVAAGWSRGRLAGVWGGVVLGCAIAAGLGAALTSLDPALTGDRMSALAAGGLLAMLTNSLMPFAFERGGAQAGFWTVVGFALAVAPSLA